MIVGIKSDRHSFWAHVALIIIDVLAAHRQARTGMHFGMLLPFNAWSGCSHTCGDKTTLCAEI